MFSREQLSNVCRIESLDAVLKAREKELEEERSKFVKLKEDFKYNLGLLNDRHNELEKYDSVLAGAVNLSFTVTLLNGQLLFRLCLHVTFSARYCLALNNGVW